MFTERIQVVDMSQVISFRFGDSEAEALAARQQPGESLNQTAQRLLKEALGLGMSTTVDAVDIDSRIAAQLEPILLELAQLKSEMAGKYVA